MVWPQAAAARAVTATARVMMVRFKVKILPIAELERPRRLAGSDRPPQVINHLLTITKTIVGSAINQACPKGH
jgi:hypothetical protein